MFNITEHQGNKSQNLIEIITLTRFKWLSSKSQDTACANYYVARNQPLYIVGRDVNQYSPYGKQFGNSFKHQRKITFQCSNLIIGYLPRKMKPTFWHAEETSALTCQALAVFPIAKVWRGSYFPSVGRQRKKATYIHSGVLLILKTTESLPLATT